MLHHTRYGAMLACTAYLMLCSLPSATAGTRRVYITGSMTTVQSVARTVVSQASRGGDGEERKEAQGLSIIWDSGVVRFGLLLAIVLCGAPLGLQWGSRLWQAWQGRVRRTREIDQLTAHFQALFRERTQGKKPCP